MYFNKMTHMHKLFFLLFLLLASCAAPGVVKDKAATVMGNSTCYDLFVDNGFMSYQHCTHQISPKCVFAMAKNSEGKQACAFARKLELVDNLCVVNCDATLTQIEALALSRCEEAKAKLPEFKNVPCKVFAHNNDLLWEDYKKDVQFK
jgi:hypothetical protein